MELISNDIEIKVIQRSEKAHKEFKSSLRKENAIRHCVNDVLAGATYSVMKQKLMEDGYNLDYKYASAQAERIIYAARDRIKDDFKEQLPTLREDMMARLLDVYTECRDMGDRFGALKSLDQMAKITGLNESKLKVDADVNQNIVIDFGFKNEEE